MARTKKNTEVTEVVEIREENEKMERANRVAVQNTEGGYVARFYRTHKFVGEIEVQTIDGMHSNEAREKAREFAIDQCPQYGIEWAPELQAQAWERKYNVYMTDAEVSEDALTLVTPAIERLVDKCKYDMELQGIEISGITPKESNLSYVEDGKYAKSGAWCCADIEVTIHTNVIGEPMDILYQMEMKSGQICKPKTTILEWNLMVLNEMTLNGIEVPVDEKKSA